MHFARAYLIVQKTLMWMFGSKYTKLKQTNVCKDYFACKTNRRPHAVGLHRLNVSGAQERERGGVTFQTVIRPLGQSYRVAHLLI